MDKPRTVLITGSGRGIGFAMARRFARLKHTVFMVDVLEDVEARAQEIRTEGGDARALLVDLSSEAAINDLISTISKEARGVDVLVNNAGISLKKPNGSKANLEEIELADWERTLRVNLTAPFMLSRAVVPHMRAQKWGRIISMSSQAGRTRALIAGAAYSASKAALMGFSRNIAAELASDGVTVNCVAPGRVETPLAKVAGKEANLKYTAEIPAGRMGTPEEIAATVAFLASDDAGYITGVTIDVNGGHFMV